MGRLSGLLILAAPVLAALAWPPVPALAQSDLTVCRYLPRHRPTPDATYQPGVDVKGRPVAPADLPGSAGATAAPQRFEIPVTLEFARRMGFRVPTGGGMAGAVPGNMEVGRLVLDGDRLLFNGQPLGGASEAELYALCRTVR